MSEILDSIGRRRKTRERHGDGYEFVRDKNKTALIAEKTAEYAEGQSSALAAAKRGYIDDIIEPDATRKRLIAAYEMLYGKKVTPVTKKHTAV